MECFWQSFWKWGSYGATLGGVGDLEQKSGNTEATAKRLSVFMSGSLNMINHHDPERGFGLHSLGYFAVGAFGASAGIEGGTGLGILMGGAANVIAGYGAGDISSGYGAAQHFVGGGLSSMTGKSFDGSISKKWKLDDPSNGMIKKKGMSKFASYGLQNVAANFAYDKSQSFFKKPLAIHGAAFMVGGIGAEVQGGIMSGG